MQDSLAASLELRPHAPAEQSDAVQVPPETHETRRLPAGFRFVDREVD